MGQLVFDKALRGRIVNPVSPGPPTPGELGEHRKIEIAVEIDVVREKAQAEVDRLPSHERKLLELLPVLATCHFDVAGVDRVCTCIVERNRESGHGDAERGATLLRLQAKDARSLAIHSVVREISPSIAGTPRKTTAYISP